MSSHHCPDPTPHDDVSRSSVETVIVPRSVDLGEMTVRSALPSEQNRMVGPFIFFDQMGPANFRSGEGIDVRPHPHINLATVTYLLEGEIRHRDSLGTDIAIRPGAVNWMRAGKGIVHSERTSDALRASGQMLSGLQTWVALPGALEESDPEFVHHGADELPIIEDGGFRCRLIAGRALGSVSPLRTASETLYVDVNLEDGSVIPFEKEYEERAVYIMSGTIEISGSRFEASQLIVLRSGKEVTATAKSDARLMFFGGEPLDGPRYIWWNFVSSRLERIEQAKQDWLHKRFDLVPNDNEEFIPLPDDRDDPCKIHNATSSSQ